MSYARSLGVIAPDATSAPSPTPTWCKALAIANLVAVTALTYTLLYKWMNRTDPLYERELHRSARTLATQR